MVVIISIKLHFLFSFSKVNLTDQVSRVVKRFRNYISSYIFYTIFFKKIRGEGGSYLVIAQEIVI